MRLINPLALVLMSALGACGCDAAATGEASAAASGRAWPDTFLTVGILADQLGRELTSGQQRFVATHFAGSQKLSLSQSQPLRALNPNFLVLHYHLAMWQSAPATTIIVDGTTWASDYPAVTPHENWFWHSPAGQRVPSRIDGKLLMNIADSGFRKYWADSIAAQVKAGDYDGVFLDSASPALLQEEVAGTDPRLRETAAKDTAFPELGGKTWTRAWEDWIAGLEGDLLKRGIPLVPNVGALATTWDDTNYRLASGIFVEGFANPALSTRDWKDATNEIMAQARAGKIVILQNYLATPEDLAKRRYYFANYLLVKGRRTYLDYFSGSTLQWFPEWGVDLGAPTSIAATVDDLAAAGVYRRDFAKGSVFVNPTEAPVTVNLRAAMNRVEPVGGGDIPGDGVPKGSVTTTPVTSVVVPARGAEILLR